MSEPERPVIHLAGRRYLVVDERVITTYDSKGRELPMTIETVREIGPHDAPH